MLFWTVLTKQLGWLLPQEVEEHKITQLRGLVPSAVEQILARLFLVTSDFVVFFGVVG